MRVSSPTHTLDFVQRPHRFPELKQPGHDRVSHNSFGRWEKGRLAKASSKGDGCFHMEDEWRGLIAMHYDRSFLCPLSAYEDLSASLGSRGMILPNK